MLLSITAKRRHCKLAQPAALSYGARMKSTSRGLLLTVAIASVLAGSARAGVFDGALIAASADWWTHLDMEAFVRSATGRAILATPGHPLLRQAGVLTELTGVAPFREVRHVTLYGSESGGVAVAEGDFRGADLIKRLQVRPDYTSRTINGATVHRWSNKPDDAGVTAASLSTPRRLLLASDEPRLLAAMAVLSGKAPSWNAQSGPLPLPRLAPPGVFFQAAARGCPAGLAGTVPGAMLRDVTVMAAAIGEAGGQAQIDLQLHAATEPAAVQLEQLANGLILTGSLGHTIGAGAAVPPWARLLAGATAARRGTMVRIHAACSPAEACELLAKALN